MNINIRNIEEKDIKFGDKAYKEVAFGYNI